VTPPRVVPFPIAASYRVAPDLQRLAAAAPSADDPGPATPFRFDTDAPAALVRLLDALVRYPDAVRWVDPTLGAAESFALAHAAAVGAADPRLQAHPDAITLPALGLRVDRDGALSAVDPRLAPAAFDASLAAAARAALARLPAATRALDALRFAVAEDLVLLRRDRPGDGGRAAYLCVVAPSGWDPGARGNASFAALHAAIPGASTLVRASAAIVDAMVTRGPFVRYVWGLATSGAFSAHARLHPAPPLTLARVATAWLRVERQTTLALPASGAALFAIRVLPQPLALALTTPERRRRFRQAIEGMDDALAAYKGFGDRALRRALVDVWGEPTVEAEGERRGATDAGGAALTRA
jgi:dimethylamine monooxygenase subunit A